MILLNKLHLKEKSLPMSQELKEVEKNKKIE